MNKRIFCGKGNDIPYVDYMKLINESFGFLTPETEFIGIHPKLYREQYRPQAEQRVKVRLALEKIAELENLEATEEEINAEYEKIANAYGVALDEVKKIVAAEDLKADLVVGKAMALVKKSSRAAK